MGINAMSKFHFWSTVGSSIWIAALAGTINGITTFTLLFERSAHMSGRATDLGVALIAPFIVDDTARRTAFLEEALIIGVITASFVFGAVCGTKLIRSIGLGRTIVIIGITIAIAGSMAFFVPEGETSVWSFERALWAFLLPFAMGMQNASTTLTPIGRTTHVTGTLTDLGVSIASNTRRKTIHLFTRWGGFVSGGAVALWMVLFIPSPAASLLLCAAFAIITGGVLAHPAVVRKLSPVVSMTGGQTDNSVAGQ